MKNSILSLVLLGLLFCGVMITSSSAFSLHPKSSSVSQISKGSIPRNNKQRQQRVRGGYANIQSSVLKMANDDKADSAAPKKKAAKKDAKDRKKANPPKKNPEKSGGDDVKAAAAAAVVEKKDDGATDEEAADAALAEVMAAATAEDEEVAVVVEEEKPKEEYYIKTKSNAGKEAFGNAVGQTAPLGYWDPIGFTQDGDKAKFDTYQLFEITHGRVSMLAVTGYLVTGPLGFRFPGAENVPAGFSKPIATLLETKSGQNILLQMLAFFTVASIINRDAEWIDNKAEHVGDFRNGSLDVGWNTFTDEEKIEQRNKEINNGRAAMMGILGLYVHEMMGVSILPGGWLP